MTSANAINALISIINTGDLSSANEWAHNNQNALAELHQPSGKAAVAHACNRWGAPMVWPWPQPRPTASQQRLITNLRTGAQGWRCSDDTVAVCIAFGWVRKTADGRLVAA